MDTLNTRAFAKINLALDVMGKLENGYHEVNMVMQSIDLWDDIAIDVQRGDGKISAYTNRSYIPTGMKNLACKAAAEFFDSTGISGYDVEMHIEKRIPVCAGMGGGSSDAAAVILGLDKIFKTGLTFGDMEHMAHRVGSDVAFCLLGGTKLATGRGEELHKLPPLPDVWIAVCKPSFSISTPVLFSKIDSCKITRHPDISGMLQALENGDIDEVARRCYNVFEDVLPQREQRIVENIKGTFLSCGALGACMTGTGSAVYGIFREELLAAESVNILSREYEQCFLAKNIKSLD